jgi:hypothetical protein
LRQDFIEKNLENKSHNTAPLDVVACLCDSRFDGLGGKRESEFEVYYKGNIVQEFLNP